MRFLLSCHVSDSPVVGPHLGLFSRLFHRAYSVGIEQEVPTQALHISVDLHFEIFYPGMMLKLKNNNKIPLVTCSVKQNRSLTKIIRSMKSGTNSISCEGFLPKRLSPKWLLSWVFWTFKNEGFSVLPGGFIRVVSWICDLKSSRVVLG